MTDTDGHSRTPARAGNGSPRYRWLKRALPLVCTVLSSSRSQAALSFLEMAVAAAQGKGSGAGWDISGEIRAALRFLRPGSTVFDIGANRGEWACAIHAALKGDVQLFLFEPQTACLPGLKAAVGRMRATVVHAAVGEAVGKATLYSPGDMAGNASLHQRKDSYFAHQAFAPAEIDVLSIDSFLATKRIEQVDFIKMDIEGHELFALRGASEALRRKAIRAFSFEFGSGNINSRTFFRDFWDLLKDRDYRIWRILPGGRLLLLEDYDEMSEQFRGVSNYIASPWGETFGKAP